MQRTGRPPIWNAKLANAICAEIAGGTPKSKACVYFGVSEDTFTRWRKARPDFERKVQAAMRKFTNILRSRIMDGRNVAGDPDWRASAWLLERIDRESYGKNDPAAATPNVTVNNSLTVVISAEQLADLQARRLKATEGLGCGRN